MSMDPSVTVWFPESVGVIAVTGADRIDLLHRMCTQDLRPLKNPPAASIALFLNNKGRLLDQVRVVALADRVHLMTTSHRGFALVNWLDGYTITDDVSYTVTEEAALSATVLGQGETFERGLGAVMATLGLAPWTADTLVCANPAQTLWALAPLPALGPGCTLTAVDAEGARVLTDALQAAFGAALAPRAQQELLIRAGLPRAEVDWVTPAAPFELRLGTDSIHWHKGCYIGQEVISRLEAYDKVARLMMGVHAPLAAGAPEEGAGVRVLHQGTAVGKVTRWVPDDTGLGRVGLCIVKREVATSGPVSLDWGGQSPAAASLFDCPQWQR